MANMDLVNFMGTAEECEAIRQFARDYAWDLACGEKLEDPEFAADQAVSEIVVGLEDEPDGEAVELLRFELFKSAVRVNAEAERVYNGNEQTKAYSTRQRQGRRRQAGKDGTLP